ncbi:zinc metalloprotease HtpX [Bacillus shivajii]|uniref:zinc metalloprotease HtpX n=1 Tax=Bacillus shivajii TaxID=1983719 RepID=UPI001CFBF982|nr:zinc metalloprotease HtpX [Bacillus shivajii]UCZ52899.1 zinc metalloprotease HtpX [Bacillus shivajii]
MTYIIDFFQNFKKRSNIGVAIYLVLNTLIVIGLFGGFGSVQGFIFGSFVYLLSLSIALSPVGEWILRLQQGCKPIARQEHKDRLMPLFDEVYRRAKELDPHLPDDVQLFISKDKMPNAFATGRKTICVTRGFLEYSDEEIKATLAHEFGHLSNKDTDLVLIVAVGNLIVTSLFIVYRLFFLAVGIIFSIAYRSIGTAISTFFIDMVLVAMMWVWTKIGTALVMHSSRQNEYLADKFAYDCGYGDNLMTVLDSFNDYEDDNSKGLWANLASSHPDPDERIAKIQELRAA